MGRRGRFIVLEGPDKSGKSTQALALVRELRRRGRTVVHTREPGGTALSEGIRELLLDPSQKVCALAEVLLYEASRAQHTQQLILPALRSGKTVLSERYALATLAYQGGARGLPMRLVRRLNRIATSGLRPDLTLVLDIPDARFRTRDPGRRHDRLERESMAFRRRVRDAYRRLSRTEPRTLLIDSDRPPEAVRTDILRRVLRLYR
ncbi:MAG: dTMP kinase [Elusimicrobiota bacterium]